MEYLGLGGGPPGFPRDFACPAVLWIPLARSQFRLPGFHRLRPAFPKLFAYRSRCFLWSSTPVGLLRPVWPPSRSLAATWEITLVFFSCRYLDVSVHGVSLPHTIYSSADDRLAPAGFPHSDTRGSMAVCASPRLFAAFCVLRRLIAPRHSPFALCSLIMLGFCCLVSCVALAFFRLFFVSFASYFSFVF